MTLLMALPNNMISILEDVKLSARLDSRHFLMSTGIFIF